MKAIVDYYLGRVLIALLAIMTLDVLWGVFTRYALGSQASWTEELARFLLIWIGTLGAAYAAGQKMHLAIDLLSPKLDPRPARVLEIVIASLIIIFVTTVMVVGGLRLIYITVHLEQTSAAMQAPMGIVYGVIPLSGLLVIYYKWEGLKVKS
jgi:TRAP-type C4-dicarboxylate transport system permease small subunit